MTGPDFEIQELSEDEKKRRAAEEQAKQVADAEAEWDPEREAAGKEREPTSIKICYNRSCPDYRVERPGHVPCACKRSAVSGAGV